MTSSTTELPRSSGSDGAFVVQAVTVIMGIVVSLTFMFGFGNVLNLALHLGVPAWVAPLVAPAVDLSILGLLLGIRQLALVGATPARLRPARRLLIFASIVTLALNVANPLVAGEYGKAAFDAVGPLLLTGWAEVGPDLLRALIDPRRLAQAAPDDLTTVQVPFAGETSAVGRTLQACENEASPGGVSADKQHDRPPSAMVDNNLFERAKQEDARHWEMHRRPISADSLRGKLRISAARSRLLVAMVRAEAHDRRASTVGLSVKTARSSRWPSRVRS